MIVRRWLYLRSTRDHTPIFVDMCGSILIFIVAHLAKENISTPAANRFSYVHLLCDSHSVSCYISYYYLVVYLT